MARDRSEVVLATVNLGGLAGALIALAAGASAHRLRPVAALFGIGVIAALYLEGANLLARRRARAQSASPVPRDVPLRKPIWISAIDGASVMMLATPLAALVGGAGFVSAGVGVVLTVLAFTALGFGLIGMIDPRALTLEREGLRVQILGATFLIRWDAIVDITRVGHERRLVRLRFSGPRVVLESVEPATKRARSRARLAIGAGGEPLGVLTLSPWTAGVDGTVLARALATARGGDADRAN